MAYLVTDHHPKEKGMAWKSKTTDHAGRMKNMPYTDRTETNGMERVLLITYGG